MSPFKSRVSCTFSNWTLQSKLIFPDILCFYVSFAIRSCVYSNVYNGDHKLIVHVRRGTGVCCLVLYGRGIFQVLLGAQSLENFKIYQFSVCAFICS